MLLHFLKTAGSYRKGQTYEIKPQLARVLIHVRTAKLADALPEEKNMKVPANRMMPAAPVTKSLDHEDEAKAPRAAAPKKAATPRASTPRKKPAPKKAEKVASESDTDKND